MKNEIIKTDEAYGVFCNNGHFQVYYCVNTDNGIKCLLEKRLPENSLIKEELGLFNVLAVFSPYKEEKIKSINWLNGRFFEKDGKYYKAIRLDILLNEFLNMKTTEMYQETIDRVERIIQNKIEKKSVINNNIWNNMVIGETNINTLPKRNQKSIIFMEREARIEFNNIYQINGMIALSRGNPEIIKVIPEGKQRIRYIDTITRETVIDKYNDKDELLNRMYYNSRSGAIVQTYFQTNEVVQYICGIKIDKNHLQNLFIDSTISNTELAVRKFKKKQRIKTVE